MTSLMVSGIGGKGDSFSGVVFTSCTALGPFILRFSNSSSEAVGKGLSTSLFEWAIAGFGAAIKRYLESVSRL